MGEQVKVLIVSATAEEIAAAGSWAKENKSPAVFCITGPGIAAAVFELTRTLMKDHDYRFVIHAGIAGSFNDSIRNGEVVEVSEECFADLGAEDGEAFIHLSEMGFGLKNAAFSNVYFPISMKAALPTGLRKARGITVNKVHGEESSIRKIRERFNPDIETMEGAAVAYVCSEFHIPCIQIRSISNRVERRDKSKWETALAIEALNKELIKLLQRI